MPTQANPVFDACCREAAQLAAAIAASAVAVQVMRAKLDGLLVVIRATEPGWTPEGK